MRTSILAVPLTILCGFALGCESYDTAPLAPESGVLFKPGKGGGNGGGGGGPPPPPPPSTIDVNFEELRPEDPGDPVDMVSGDPQTGIAGENSEERIETSAPITLRYSVKSNDFISGSNCLTDPELDLIKLFNDRDVTSSQVRLLVDKKRDKKGSWEHVSRAIVTLGGLQNPDDPSDPHIYEIDLLGFQNNPEYDADRDVRIDDKDPLWTIVTVDNQRVQVERRQKRSLKERDICRGVVFYTLKVSKG